MKWPRITLVTPSLNQGRYLETAIRSVLSQHYPNLEYFVLDGGSTDSTKDILRRYQSSFTRMVSRRDDGQADALQRGLEWGTGEIFHWLNADDRLAPGALRRVAQAFAGADAVAGGWINFSEEGEAEPELCANLTPRKLIRGGRGTIFHQPALWLRREAVLACGGIEKGYHYAFDWDLAIRYLHFFPTVRYLSRPLMYFRHHGESKTAKVGNLFPQERVNILRALLCNENYLSLHRACGERLATEAWWQELAKIAPDQSLSRPLKAWAILRAAGGNPSVRFSRMTAGALRRTLFGGQER